MHVRPAFPLAPGFGCEVRMTIDALRAGPERRRGRGRPRPSGHGARRRRLSPPRPPVARHLLANGPLARQLPWSAHPAGRLGRRPAERARRSALVPRSASLTISSSGEERGIPSPSGRAADDGHPEAGRHSRSSGSAATRSLSERRTARCPLREPDESVGHETGQGDQVVHGRRARARCAGRNRRPALPLRSARDARCLATPDPTRWGPC